MDMMPYEDFDALEARVREMARQHPLPPEVTRVEVRFGTLWDGEPVVWVDLHVPTSRRLSAPEIEEWASTKLLLSDGARMIAPGRMASVRFVPDQPAAA